MLDITLITDTSDPAELYATYQELATRYDQAQAQLDELSAEMNRAEQEDSDDREHLVAELDRLGVGHSVLLGWVSAFFAAYTFALRGTDTPWIEARTSARVVDANHRLRPLAPARKNRGRR